MDSFIREVTERMKGREEEIISTVNQEGPKSDIDAELELLLKKQLARIKFIGVGGAGNNTINRIT